MGLLRDRRFGLYFLGSLASNTGVWFRNVAAILAVYEATGSAVMVGLVTATQFGMQLVLAPWSGAVADRMDRRTMILLGQVLGAASAVALTALAFTGALSPSLILALVGLGGIGQAVSGPAAQALVPNLVSPAEVPQAIALHSVTFHLSRAIGPIAGAATFALAGPGIAFGVNASGYLAFALALLGMPQDRRSSRQPPGRRLGVLEGVRYTRRHPQLLRFLGTVALLAVAVEPVNTLTPLFATGFGGGEVLVGVLITCFGAGSMVVAGGVGPLRRRLGAGRAGLAGMAALVIGMTVLAGSPVPVPAAVGLALAGAGYLLAVSDVTASLQQRLDDGVRGRVMALWAMCFLGIRPAAALLHGWLGDTFSASAGALAGVLAAVTAVAVLTGGSSPHRRGRRTSTTPDAGR